MPREGERKRNRGEKGRGDEGETMGVMEERWGRGRERGREGVRARGKEYFSIYILLTLAPKHCSQLKLRRRSGNSET